MASRIKSAPSDLVGLLAARPVLEGHVRRRLLALPNVRAIEHCAVQGLVADDNGAAIRGVRVKVDNGAEQIIAADLVVDASGRGSSSPAWLESLGYARPEEEKIEIGIGYTTRVYRRRPADLGGKLAVVVAGSGPNWRNGAVLFQTEDRWIVSIGGYFGDHAPDDDQMFAAYAGSLPTPDIHDIVAHAEPLTDFVRYRYPANLRRRYERLDAVPERLSGVRRRHVQLQSGLRPGHDGGGAGSVRCCTNASLRRRRSGAAFLQRGERCDRYALGHRRRQRSAPSAGVGSAFAARCASSTGTSASCTWPRVTTPCWRNAFLKVANLQAPPTRLLHPAVVLRVMWGNLRRRGRPGAKVAQARASARYSLRS